MSKDFKTYEVDSLYPTPEGSVHLLLGCRRSDYSASNIAKAVEDIDAHLLSLNVMLDHEGTYDMLIDIRINRQNGEAAARSLERYGFEVIGITSDESSDDSTLRDRIEELLRYINV